MKNFLFAALLSALALPLTAPATAAPVSAPSDNPAPEFFPEKNITPAAKILLERAKSGNGDAILQVAIAYAAGEKGFPKNPEAAVFWWNKGAEMGDAISQNYLAGAYSRGDGVEKNPEKAYELWYKAAERGFPEAQFNAGVCAAN